MADFKSQIDPSLLSSTSLTSIFFSHCPLKKEKDFYDVAQPLGLNGFP
jgi:hypothetical protein